MTGGLPDLVSEESPVRVTVSGSLQHLCPHVEERDLGAVTISWTCAGSTLELHSLAEYLRSFSDDVISHEHITRAIRDDLSAMFGIADVTVVSSWETAGLQVKVSA